ncbi:MAG: biotin/lipoyl-binding protein, partial [Thiothrix litoralis]
MKVPRVLLLACLSLLPACQESATNTLQGYVEGEYVHLAAPFAGTLQTLAVQRGAQVKQGDPAFTLEQQNETAARPDALKVAEANVAAARAALQQADWQLAQKTVTATRNGLVNDTYYQQ